MTGSLGVLAMCLTAMTIINVGGTVMLKRFADEAQLYFLIIGLAAYGLGGLIYARVLKFQELASAGALTSSVQIILIYASGVLILGETLTARQLVGVCLSCVAALLLLPTIARPS